MRPRANSPARGLFTVTTPTTKTAPLMRTKTVKVELDEANRSVLARFATLGVIDKDGDIIEKGAIGRRAERTHGMAYNHGFDTLLLPAMASPTKTMTMPCSEGDFPKNDLVRSEQHVPDGQTTERRRRIDDGVVVPVLHSRKAGSRFGTRKRRSASRNSEIAHVAPGGSRRRREHGDAGREELRAGVPGGDAGGGPHPKRRRRQTRRRPSRQALILRRSPATFLALLPRRWPRPWG